MKAQKHLITHLFLFISLFSFGQSTIYTNDMDYVLGDVKQGFITGTIDDGAKIINLLNGFKEMKVNGIRIPIFPEGTDYDEELLAFFVTQARLRDFDIFANPAQDAGGKRIANKTLKSSDQVAVKDDAEKRQILIDRIVWANETYDLKWINPFNEDARTGSIWSVNDMNVIYSTLYEKLEDVEMVGSCAWGIPASIDVLTKTNIKDYITVSTTHNLGFNHSSWTEFIALSEDAGLPVWDSEVNNATNSNGGSTRIEAAIEYGVDGLVLYNSWNFINLTTGVVNATGEKFMNMYLKTSSIDETYRNVKFTDIYNEDQGFRIEFITEENHDISIVDITGKQVRSYTNCADSKVLVSGLEQGMYVVLLSSENSKQVEKVIVY